MTRTSRSKPFANAFGECVVKASGFDGEQPTMAMVTPSPPQACVVNVRLVYELGTCFREAAGV
jgi:hypothetical protein